MLPYSRNTNYAPGSQVKSADLKDLQDKIVELFRGRGRIYQRFWLHDGIVNADADPVGGAVDDWLYDKDGASSELSFGIQTTNSVGRFASFILSGAGTDANRLAMKWALSQPSGRTVQGLELMINAPSGLSGDFAFGWDARALTGALSFDGRFDASASYMVIAKEDGVANYHALVSDGLAETDLDLAVAPASNNDWDRLTIIHLGDALAGGGIVEFYVNDVLAGTVDTNIPGIGDVLEVWNPQILWMEAGTGLAGDVVRFTQVTQYYFDDLVRFGT